MMLKKTLEKIVSPVAITSLCSSLLFNCSWKLVETKTEVTPKKTWTKTIDLGTKQKTKEEIDFDIVKEKEGIKISATETKYNITEKIIEKQEIKDSVVTTYEIYKRPNATSRIAFFSIFLGSMVPTVLTFYFGGFNDETGALGTIYVVSGVVLGYMVGASISGETKTEKNEEYIQEIIDKKTTYKIIDKKILGKGPQPLSNAKLRICSKDLGIDTSLNTDKNGNAYLPNVRFFTYKEFEKKNSAFLGICDLKKIYSKLDDKKIEITIEYQGKKYEKSIIDKDSDKEKMLDLLKKECFESF